MPQVNDAEWSDLLAPYAVGLELSADMRLKLATYLDLLLRWNSRTNLTAVREPRQIVQRQIGESLFAGHLLAQAGTLLDFGSGAGFPGIPLQIALPKLRVTLAESQGKKAGFLREAVRVLGLSSTVWPGRVEAIEPACRFDVVAMRAVDRSGAMLPIAAKRVAPEGALLLYMGSHAGGGELAGWSGEVESVPGNGGSLVLFRRESVFHVEQRI